MPRQHATARNEKPCISVCSIAPTPVAPVAEPGVRASKPVAAPALPSITAGPRNRWSDFGSIGALNEKAPERQMRAPVGAASTAAARSSVGPTSVTSHTTSAVATAPGGQTGMSTTNNAETRYRRVVLPPSATGAPTSHASLTLCARRVKLWAAPRWTWLPRRPREGVACRTMTDAYRIGEAAKALGVRVETLRRWERDGKLRVERTEGGQRTVPASEVARLLSERRHEEPIAQASARNRFPGVITEVKRDGLAATVEIQAGPHRVWALITREAADQMGLGARHGGGRDGQGHERHGESSGWIAPGFRYLSL